MPEPTIQSRAWGSRLLFMAGFVVFLAAQGYMLIAPLSNWTLLPEIDDTLTYVLKTQQMKECFSQTCPALVDLRQQLHVVLPNPEAARQQALASSRVFPVYHPLFSVLLLSLSGLGMSLMESYRFLWCLAPGIFGLAFAYFLNTLVGPGPAGVALLLLAFKVFPDTGLHHLVPSNFTMALALLLFGRLIACQGRAPWSLVLGSLVLMAMHLIGVIYAGMAALLSIFLVEKEERRQVVLPVVAVAVGIGTLFLVYKLIRSTVGVMFAFPSLFPTGNQAFRYWIRGVAANLAQVVIENIRVAEGLWGMAPFFWGALTVGLVTLSPKRRQIILKITLIYLLALGGVLFYVSSHPADYLFRLWIPLVVILFGLVGQGVCAVMGWAGVWWSQYREALWGQEFKGLQQFWPLALIAVTLGYLGDMVVKGAEQVIAMGQYLREREPLALFPSQPELLLSEARPGDRVLYTSIIAMDYYLIHGALKLGAVYYHPAFKGSFIETDWLRRPGLRFVVAYQPTVFHPSFVGVDENNWWITRPDFRYSYLSRPRRYGPAAREGKIPVALYRELTVKLKNEDRPQTLRINLENQGGPGIVQVIPLDPLGQPREEGRQEIKIRKGWSGWLTVDLRPLTPWSALMLKFPGDRDRYQVAGLAFDQDPHLWPWNRKARLTFHPRDGGSPAFTVSFDPKDLLPEALKSRPVTVLDDQGSSVLLMLY